MAETHRSGRVAPFERRGAHANGRPVKDVGATARSLADELADELEQRGVPPGAWLLDIARTRRALQEADTLLRRLEDAVIRGASSAPLDGS